MSVKVDSFEGGKSEQGLRRDQTSWGRGGGPIWYKTCTLAQHDELIFGTNVKSLFKKNWD